MLLEVVDLAIDLPTPRGPRRVVRDVSFSASAGESLGIVGESGSGKTMTALALDGAAARRRRRLGRAALRGTRSARARRGRAAQAARRPDRDDLSGADERAQSVASDRRAGRRAADAASRPVEGGGMGRGGQAARSRAVARSRRNRARLSVRAFRRRAAARDDRDGVELPAAIDHRGRADHRARRHRAGENPRLCSRPSAPRKTWRCCSSATISR